MEEMRVIANWISQLDGKKAWEEVKSVADRIFHPDYVLLKGGSEVPYEVVMGSLGKMLMAGVVARLVKVRKVDDGIEGTWDSFYPDGRRTRLQSVWSFEDGKIVKSRHVRSQGGSPSTVPKRILSFEKELSALTNEKDSNASSSDETEFSSYSEDEEDTASEENEEPITLKRVSSAGKSLVSQQTKHRRKKSLSARSLRQKFASSKSSSSSNI
mmetsp:Transcript_1611/g.4328  ORF Transcript_1611/g.4328 Transcript_1611/m.4328 type:complete len:213 (-) Transcript_1611:90-728(-)|eukprot:CAMPEP_0113531844 /NCGR_PEP_ID=MMETSP0015_2-20120614/3721_1 /TAXON_ID=2838 /ORGANISM="Odontella" /LENGTH=212 /DNA_ID=CAMNT_0000430723 /DNA_START=243 /DNA_END=881 /DNA_ORIENTATION=+ /assembly_acc=CAM_ASM_000160